jgi:DNA replication protein DnaC
MALAAGDGWLDQDANILLFGPLGNGKSHLRRVGLSWH